MISPGAEDRYAAIERLYSLGQWQEVLDQGAALLTELAEGGIAADPSLQPRLLLLQGHSRLHGLGQVEAAAALYQQVLDGPAEPVLQAVARQQLNLAHSMRQAPAAPWSSAEDAELASGLLEVMLR